MTSSEAGELQVGMRVLIADHFSSYPSERLKKYLGTEQIITYIRGAADIRVDGCNVGFFASEIVKVIHPEIDGDSEYEYGDLQLIFGGECQ